MTRHPIRRGLLAALLAGAASLSTAAAHEPAAHHLRADNLRADHQSADHHRAHLPTAQERTPELFKPAYADAAPHFPRPAPLQRPPLYEGLGSLSLAVTTRSAEAQAYFDQGLRLAWAFNHAEARRSFREAQRLDPDCALCYWGEAWVLGPNINDAMAAEMAGPAHVAVTRARALLGSVTPKEQALIQALSRRYAPSPTADRGALDRAWAEAMAEVAAAHPDDVDVLAFYADALMNLQPWDYWEADGVTPRGAGGTIVALLERALALEPDHPAAAHLYIHAVEASADPGRAEAVADRLRGAMPAAGHLAHMPAHIYARVGRHRDSIEVNREAIAADEHFLEQAGPAASDLYRFGYYPHNLHYLLVSAQFAGLAEDVISAAEKLAGITSDAVSQQLAWVQAIKTAPYSAQAQFGETETILGLPDPGDRFPFVKGFWHYARGTAFARAGDLAAAEAEAAAIVGLIEGADMSDLEAQYLPAAEVLAIAGKIVQARVAQARGDQGPAERLLREAVALQDGLPYMEPPYWYYPVRQTLGAVLLQQGRAEEAAAVFEQALAETPRNGWVLWGLAQARRAAGAPGLAAAEAAFGEAWLGDAALLSLERL